MSKDAKDMTDFGIFYPRGHLVVAFTKTEDAERVQRNLEDHTGMLARLGKSDEAVRQHLDAARHGDTFLLIYAPGDTESERAMNVVRRVPFEFAHRYHRFAIQTLK